MPVGKKICPECQSECGVRTQECYCGHQFDVKGGKPKTPKVVKTPKAPKEPKLKLIKTYDEPGQGRKLCAKCDKYIGAILQTCICGSTEFVKKVVQTGPKPIQLHDEPSKGRKQCAGCHKYIASVLLKCACGSTEFVRKVVEPKPPKEVQTYNEAGPGRKQCAKCSQFLAAVHRHCACGSEEFVSKKAETYDKGGHGRKQCPECKTFVGRSVISCPCGKHEWEEGAPEEPAVKKDRFNIPTRGDVEASKHQSRCGCGKRIIIAPRGDAPKLHGTDNNAVCAWVEKTIKQGHEEEAVHYSPAALRYFLTRQFDPDMSNHTAEELDTVISHLNNCVTGEDESVDPYEDQCEVTDDDDLSAEMAEDLVEDLAAI